MIKLSRAELLHERAAFCKRLAIGAGDPGFSEKLQALADEYEAEAAQAALQAGPQPGFGEASNTRPQHQTG
ncbi:hypothetical protein [Bradyrhizobium icense]|uniref:hypothetical protein n=1 Tax=Bradyrhizobium icense TaxID=1274631 RepID=UPI0012EA810B|nr:hypothetical protein [Bradyrhizobium icense]